MVLLSRSVDKFLEAAYGVVIYKDKRTLRHSYWVVFNKKHMYNLYAQHTRIHTTSILATILQHLNQKGLLSQKTTLP